MKNDVKVKMQSFWYTKEILLEIYMGSPTEAID